MERNPTVNNDRFLELLTSGLVITGEGIGEVTRELSPSRFEVKVDGVEKPFVFGAPEIQTISPNLVIQVVNLNGRLLANAFFCADEEVQHFIDRTHAENETVHVVDLTTGRLHANQILGVLLEDTPIALFCCWVNLWTQLKLELFPSEDAEAQLREFTEKTEGYIGTSGHISVDLLIDFEASQVLAIRLMAGWRNVYHRTYAIPA